MKAMKQIWIFVGLAIFAPTPATRADPIVLQTYYEDEVVGNCNNSFACIAHFAKTPSGKPVEFTNISCYIQTSKPIRIAIFGVKVNTSAFLIRTAYLTPSLVSTGNSLYYYSISLPFRFAVGGDRYPTIDVETSQGGTIYYSCNLVGTPKNSL